MLIVYDQQLFDVPQFATKYHLGKLLHPSLLLRVSGARLLVFLSNALCFQDRSLCCSRCIHSGCTQ